MKRLIYILILLIMCSFVLSAQPADQVFIGPDGLEIKYPVLNYHQINTGFTQHFHIFNLSNGYNYKDGDDINCTLHVYNPSGSHIYTNWTTTFDDIYDIEFYLYPTLFTEVGDYSEIIQCSNDGQGGFSAFPLYVTYDGTDRENNLYPIVIMEIFLICVLIFITKIVFSSDFDSKGFWLGVNCLVLALLETFLLIGVIFIDHIHGDITGLLSINFYVILLNSAFWFITMLITMVGVMIEPSESSDKWTDINPGKKW